MSHEQGKKICISVVIPVLNEEVRLPACLDSIQKQAYDASAVEVLVVDGGSTDGTKRIVSEYGYTVIDNPWKLGDIGSRVGYSAARGDIVILTAADTAFPHPHFFSTIEEGFLRETKAVAGFFPVDTDPHDKRNSLISRYINLGTDPFNLFVYGRAYCYYPWLHKRVVSKKTTEKYDVFLFDIEHHPLLAIAQGFTFHKNRFDVELLHDMQGDDLFPVLKMIEHGDRFLFFHSCFIKHYIFRDWKHFLEKMEKKIAFAFMNPQAWGFQRREHLLSPRRKIKKYLFIPYALLIVPACIQALVWYGRERRIEILLHPLVSFIVCIMLLKHALLELYHRLFLSNSDQSIR